MSQFPGNTTLADCGYYLRDYLDVPYRQSIAGFTPAQQYYNDLLTRERMLIERAFGIVKRRFPILQHPLRVNIESWPKIILACFILHNVSVHLNDPVETGWLLLPEEPVPVDGTGRDATAGEQHLVNAGRQARTLKTQQLYATRGG